MSISKAITNLLRKNAHIFGSFCKFYSNLEKNRIKFVKKMSKKNEKKKSNGISRSRNIKSKSKLDKISIYFLHIKREIIALRIWWSFQFPLWRFKQFVNFNKFSLVLLVCVLFFLHFLLLFCSRSCYSFLLFENATVCWSFTIFPYLFSTYEKHNVQSSTLINFSVNASAHLPGKISRKLCREHTYFKVIAANVSVSWLARTRLFCSQCILTENIYICFVHLRKLVQIGREWEKEQANDK